MEPKEPHTQQPAGVPPVPQSPGPPPTPRPNPSQGQSIDGFTSSPTPVTATDLGAPQTPPTPTPEPAPQVPQQNSQQVQKTVLKDKRFGQLRGFASFLVFIGGVMVVAFLINQFIFHSYFVEGTSMVSTLQNNDRLIIEKVSRSVSNLQGKSYMPERGQIVVLNSSLIAANGSHEQLIKRVIGLPGDTVLVKDGVVTVKNQENPDGFDVDKQLGINVEPTYSSGPMEFSVPENHVFVMGDNRTQNGSHDSRAFGPVDTKELEGRLWARILPIDKAQIFP